MAAAESVRSVEPPRLGLAVAPLLTLALFIQYIDRGNIATAAPLIQRDLGINAAEIGVLISAFYWTYTPSQLLMGWLTHRLNAYRTLALGLALWSLATIGTAFAGGFAAILALRLLLGVGESAFFPCSSRLLAQHMPSSRLGAANGFIGVGLALGPAVGTWVGGNLMAVSSWRTSFLIFGALSLLWLAPWRQATRHLDRADVEGPKTPSPTYFQILARREAWGSALGHFSANWTFYFVISWLPFYLVKERGFSMTEMAGIAGSLYVLQAIGNIATGWLADLWMRAGASANLARKSFMIASHLIVGVALLGAVYDNTTVVIACLALASIGFGFGTPALFAIGQTLAGPKAAGKWMGIQNGVGNIAGIVGPVVTGLIIHETHSFTWTFVVSGLISLAGVLCWWVVIPRVAPLEWELKAAA
jgi:MFS family permease